MTKQNEMPKPDWQTADGRVVLYNRDCMEVLPLLGKVDAVVTDPPYGMNLDTDSTRFKGGGSPGVCRDPIIGDDQPFDPSPLLALRVPAVIWGANHFSARLPVGKTLIWLKQNPASYGVFLSDAEIAWASGGNGIWSFYRPRSIATAVSEGGGRVAHPTQKPVAVMEWSLTFVANASVILDPYMGSGTTGVACARMGRSFIGCEIDPTHFATAVRRIEAELNRAPLFEPPPIIQRTLIDAD